MKIVFSKKGKYRISSSEVAIVGEDDVNKTEFEVDADKAVIFMEADGLVKSPKKAPTKKEPEVKAEK